MVELLEGALADVKHSVALETKHAEEWNVLERLGRNRFESIALEVENLEVLKSVKGVWCDRFDVVSGEVELLEC